MYLKIIGLDLMEKLWMAYYSDRIDQYDFALKIFGNIFLK